MMRLNDDDRRDWLDNDEGLYDWWRYSRLSKREFIKFHREEIDSHVNAVLERKPE
jgi:hypothetical protein